MATNTAQPIAVPQGSAGSHRQHAVSSLQARRATAKDARDFVCNGDLCVAVAVVAELLTILPNAESIASSLLCAVVFVTRFGGLAPVLLAIALICRLSFYRAPPKNALV
jgi:hypothetical protein